MKKNIAKKAITGILALALAAGCTQPGTADASTAKLNKTNLTLTQGKQCTLKVKGISGKITWKSSNKKIAAVSKKGKVTAKTAGTAKITAKVKSKKLICRVTVKKKKTTANTQAPGAIQTPVTTQMPAITQTPVATQIPANTQTPIIIQTPTTTQTPVTTQMPVITQTPATTQFPIIVWKPISTQVPVNTKKPTVTQTPTATKLPEATQTPSATKMPDATQTPSTTNVTEESAYLTLNSLRNTYPEGMTLTNSYYYYSPQFGNGYGCYGFSAKLSDTVFGTSAPCKTHSSFSQIKVGDNIRIGNSHSVIVLTKGDNYITVVEGNYNSSVHWDRKITASSLASSGFTVYTRY